MKSADADFFSRHFLLKIDGIFVHFSLNNYKSFKVLLIADTRT